MRRKKYLKKACLTIKSIYIYIKLHIFYTNRIELCFINSIKGKFKVDLCKTGNLKIGKFLMSAGPCYFKCLENSKCEIGNRVFHNQNCSNTSEKEIRIGDNCNIANNVVIVDHDHNLGECGVEDGLVSSPIHIGENVWVGANAVILRGVEIGDGSVIAAGAVVNKNVPAYELWGGMPAKKIKSLR